MKFPEMRILLLHQGTPLEDHWVPAVSSCQLAHKPVQTLASLLLHHFIYLSSFLRTQTQTLISYNTFKIAVIKFGTISGLGKKNYEKKKKTSFGCKNNEGRIVK